MFFLSSTARHECQHEQKTASSDFFLIQILGRVNYSKGPPEVLVALGIQSKLKRTFVKGMITEAGCRV